MNLTVIANTTDPILLDPYSCGPGLEIKNIQVSVSDAYRVPRLNDILFSLTQPTFSWNQNVLLELTWNGASIDYQMFRSNSMHNW